MRRGVNDDERSAPPVVVRLAGASERPLIEGLFQFYAYDFSEMEPADSQGFEVDARGRFEAYPYLDAYWSADDRWPLLIQFGGQTVGFALINRLSHVGGSIDHNMGEFFVLRKHRRRGVAMAAVHKIFRLYPGRWEVAVVERNGVGKSFWAKAIAEAPNVADAYVVQGDGQHWRGPIWCFRSSDR
jgi:predicted acetyltransferase